MVRPVRSASTLSMDVHNDEELARALAELDAAERKLGEVAA